MLNVEFIGALKIRRPREKQKKGKELELPLKHNAEEEKYKKNLQKERGSDCRVRIFGTLAKAVNSGNPVNCLSIKATNVI